MESTLENYYFIYVYINSFSTSAFGDPNGSAGGAKWSPGAGAGTGTGTGAGPGAEKPALEAAPGTIWNAGGSKKPIRRNKKAAGGTQMAAWPPHCGAREVKRVVLT